MLHRNKTALVSLPRFWEVRAGCKCGGAQAVASGSSVNCTPWSLKSLKCSFVADKNGNFVRLWISCNKRSQNTVT